MAGQHRLQVVLQRLGAVLQRALGDGRVADLLDSLRQLRPHGLRSSTYATAARRLVGWQLMRCRQVPRDARAWIPALRTPAAKPLDYTRSLTLTIIAAATSPSGSLVGPGGLLGLQNPTAAPSLRWSDAAQ